MYLFIFRAFNKETLKIALSEESRVKRNRKRMVNLQMTVFSWSLEFITGLVCLSIVIKSPDPETNVDLISGLVIFDAFLNFIIIPSSYILNNESIKKVIIAEGWCRFFRSHKRPNKVSSELSRDGRNKVTKPRYLSPISTISGNIQALEDKQIGLVVEDLENTFHMMTASNIFSNFSR